jgi:glutamate decarboxylase
MPTFSLNFSRPGSEVITQYFMFMSLGRSGYARVMRNLQQIATHIAAGVADMGPYQLLSEGRDLPVFAFALKPEIENYSVFDVSDRLRERGWLVPAYTFPENRQDLSVLRIVVRSGMNIEMADKLLEHLGEQTNALQALTAPLPRPAFQPRAAFRH